MAQLLGSLDSSRNLQANYTISFLFRLDLILHACKIPLRCDSFGILNFGTKQEVESQFIFSHRASGFADTALVTLIRVSV